MCDVTDGPRTLHATSTALWQRPYGRTATKQQSAEWLYHLPPAEASGRNCQHRRSWLAAGQIKLTFCFPSLDNVQ